MNIYQQQLRSQLTTKASRHILKILSTESNTWSKLFDVFKAKKKRELGKEMNSEKVQLSYLFLREQMKIEIKKLFVPYANDVHLLALLESFFNDVEWDVLACILIEEFERYVKKSKV